MKNSKKVFALMMAFVMMTALIPSIAVLTGSVVSAAELSAFDAMNTDFYSVVFGPVDYQDKEAGSGGSQFYSTGVYQKFLPDGENIYMQAKTPLTTGASKSLNYPNWDGDFSADTAGNGGSGNFAVMGDSGEYVIQSKIMFHQNGVYESVWADMCWYSNLTAKYDDGSSASIGYKTVGDSTVSSDGNMTNFCDDVVDYISLTKGSIQKQSIGVIKTDVWYTIRETYNLDNDTTSFEIVHPDGTSYKYSASDSRLKDAALTFVRYDVNIKSIYEEGFSIDDFVISKTVNKPVKVTFDEDAGSVSVGGDVLASGDVVTVPYDGKTDKVMTFIPSSGYVISDVTVGGVSKGSISSLRVDSIAGDVEVIFEKITASTPFMVEIYSEDYQDKNVGDKSQFYTKGVYSEIVSENGNNFMRAKTEGTSGASLTLDYPNWNGDFSADTAGKGGNGVYAAMGSSGEYVIESKIMFHQSAVYDEVWADMVWYSCISLEGTKGTGNESNMGWTTDGGSTAMTNFCDDAEDYVSLRGNTSVQNKPVGVLKTDVWYTIRETYNLETDTTTFEIIHPDGTSYKYEAFDARLDGAELSFIRYDVGIKDTNGEGFSMDDFKIEKTYMKPVTINYDSTKGKVYMYGEAVEPGSDMPVPFNSDSAAVIEIKPESGYRISDVKLNGKSKGPTVTGLELKNIMDSQMIEVTFESVDDVPSAPVFSLVEINGHPRIGNELSVNAEAFDLNGDEIIGYEYVWEVSSDGKTGWSAVGTDEVYTVSASDSGKYIRVGVKAKTDAKDLPDSEIAYSDVMGPAGENVTVNYYVSPDGDDDNSGTFSSPFATITRARDIIRTLEKNENISYVVNIRGGIYEIESSIDFSAADSGLDGNPVIYQAYNGENVVFTGAKQLDASKIEKVTDEELLGRLLEPAAKEKLMMLDFKKLGVELPARQPNGYGGKQTVFLNGVSLINARWPNDDKTGEHYFTKASAAFELTGDDVGKYNEANQPVKMKYRDDEGRTAKWEIKPGDSMVGGALTYLWDRRTVYLAELDTENLFFVTKDALGTGQNTYTGKSERWVYFENIFEEIDMPGESYIDRDNEVLYFYPVGDMENPEMSVSVLDETMFDVYGGASNITFRGLNLASSRTTAVNIDNTCDSINFEDGSVSGISGVGIGVFGTNCIIDGNDLYNISGNAINLQSGNREELISSGCVVSNNSIRGCAGISDAVNLRGVGHVVSNNEIYDYDMGAVRLLETNNVIIEYNDIHDVEVLNSDGGALYWGRNPTELGNIVRYNYFHDIGGDIGSHGQQAVFVDDGGTGPAIYGNILYYGGGGTTEAALKYNTGQFHNIYHNIIMENRDALLGEQWDYNKWVGKIEGTAEAVPARWWTYVFDFADIWELSTSACFNMTYYGKTSRKDLMISDKWYEYYTETEPTGQWAPLFEAYMNKEIWEEASALHQAGDKEGLVNFINETIPERYTNDFKNNVLINVEKDVNGYANTENNIKFTASQAIGFFEDYGTDFSLTDAGYNAIKAKIPDFERLDFDSMGMTTPRSSVPSVKNAVISGYPSEGQTLTASYDFEDADGDSEGLSKIYWYVGNNRDSQYTRIEGVLGESIEVPAEYKGKYLRYEIVPYDTTYAKGKKVVSEPVFVIYDIEEANARIAEVEAIAENAVIGTEPGNYPESAVHNLKAAIETAKADIVLVKNQSGVDEVMKALERALTVFNNRVIKDRSDDEEDPGETPSYGGGSPAGGGGGGGSSSSGNKVTYDGTQENFAPVEPSVTPSAPGKFVFDDVKGHWAEADVMAMYEAGIVSGVTATTFEPDREITRAEFATLIAKALKLEDGEADFADVTADDWFAPFVGAAAKAGIIVGSDGLFRPNDTITRQEMAVIVVKAYEYLGKTADAAELAFSDNSEIADWAKEFVAKAVGAGLISGMGDNLFAPVDNATRAQSASIISRLLK